MVMRASLITFPHLANSVFILAANSSGVVGVGSTPMLANFSLSSGDLIILTISWCSRLMIAAGVLAGAHMPIRPAYSYPGKPADATVGKPGTSAEGSALVTAKAFNLPDFTWGPTDGVLPMVS